jgi:hypothetical protein
LNRAGAPEESENIALFWKPGLRQKWRIFRALPEARTVLGPQASAIEIGSRSMIY